MSALRFKTTMKINGANPYIAISAAQARRLRAEWRKPMPVLVQINGQPAEPWKINMMPTGNGSYYLYLHEIVRKASGTKVGDNVEVFVRFDKSYRSGPGQIPAWLQKPLAANRQAMAAWQALPPSRQKEVIRYAAGLKSAAAQARNLERIMFVLSGNDGRYMARDWHGGK